MSDDEAPRPLDDDEDEVVGRYPGIPDDLEEDDSDDPEVTDDGEEEPRAEPEAEPDPEPEQEPEPEPTYEDEQEDEEIEDEEYVEADDSYLDEPDEDDPYAPPQQIRRADLPPAAAASTKDDAQHDEDTGQSMFAGVGRGVVWLAIGAAVLSPLAVIAANLGLGLGLPQQTLILAATMVLLIIANVVFPFISWHPKHSAGKALDRGSQSTWVALVSVLVVNLAAALIVVELLALLVFVGAWTPTGPAQLAFVQRFPLVLSAILLADALILTLRQQVPQTEKAVGWRRITANALTVLAVAWVGVGVLFALGTVSVAGIEPRQAVYLVTLGAVLEFLSVRWRLALPTVTGLLRDSMQEIQRADEKMRDELARRGRRIYIAGFIFVAFSMGATAMLMTGTIDLGSSIDLLPVIILYSIVALALMGFLLVRTMQARYLESQLRGDDDPLAGLVGKPPLSPKQLMRQVTYWSTGSLAVLSVVLAVLTFAGIMPWGATYGTDILIAGVLFGAGPFGIFYNQDLKRAKAMDDRFPEFLRDIAESARAGMTLPRALLTAAEGDYGELNDDIRKMAHQVEWGVPFDDAMTRFKERARTPLIDRTVTLVLQAGRAGGNVVDSLTAASDDARAIQEITEERNSQMGLYMMVVYVAFFVFLGVVMVLLAQFLPAFQQAVSDTGGGAQVGGLNIQPFDNEDFIRIFFHAALLQAIGGGLVGGVLSKGDLITGFPHAGAMIVASWIAFRVVAGVII